MERIIPILILQLFFMPLLTLRTNFMVKGKCTISAVFGFLEAIVYIFGLSLVLSEQNDILVMFTYAIGFAVGICIGGIIEKKLAIGTITISVNLKNYNQTLINILRKKDFHFTVFKGTGVDGDRYKFDILVTRHKENELVKIIEEYEPDSFILILEPRKYKSRDNAKFK